MANSGLMPMPPARGVHSFTSQLNLSAFCGIGGACRGCSEVVWRVLGGEQGELFL
jgi:hypothetical protein